MVPYLFPGRCGGLAINGLAVAATARRLGAGSALLEAAAAEGVHPDEFLIEGGLVAALDMALML